MVNIIDELKERGLIKDFSNEEEVHKMFERKRFWIVKD